jgi:signal transduction histidine kinase
MTTTPGKRSNLKGKGKTVWPELWTLLDGLTNASSEERVIHLLVNGAPALGFQNARYYDVNFCPFRKHFFFTLRGANRDYPDAPIGYLIYDGTITDDQLLEGKVAWKYHDNREQTSDKDSKKWIGHLGLWNRLSLDVPIRSGRDAVLGLWAMDRSQPTNASETEIIPILHVASVAALRIQQMRRANINKLALSIFQRPSFEADGGANLRLCLEDICRSLNAFCLAFFRLDPVFGALDKVIEVYRDDGGFKVVEDEADRRYALGHCLTGQAWLSQEMRFIPDFEQLAQAKPLLADPSSVSLHERLLRSKLKCVIYHRFDVPGAAPGLIRAMNRSDVPSLRFTVQHQDILERIAYPFAQVLGINDASSKLQCVWEAFSQTLESLRLEALNFRHVAQAACQVGLPFMIVTIWRQDGSYIEGWSNDQLVQSDLKRLAGEKVSVGLLDSEKPGILAVGTMQGPLRAILLSHDVTDVYVVPSREKPSERVEPEITLTLFPLKILPRNSGEAAVYDLGFSWERYPNVLKALDLLGKVTGNVRQLARNRSLLYLAEQAVGTIGHEMRSPGARIVSLGQKLSDLFRDVVSHLPPQVAVEGSVTGVGPRGSYSEMRLKDRSMVLKWVSETDEALDIYATQLRSVVDKALWWARLEGRVIEMQLKEINVHELIRRCVEEFEIELKAKPGLRVVIKDSVSRLPRLVADPMMMQVLFVNLIDNAIKYSHNPTSIHRYEVVISGERQPALIDITITNWGLGIDESEYSSIFSTFFRSSVRDRLHTVRGVGLGLSMCKTIATLHKGTIRVKSVPTLEDPAKLSAKEGYLTTFTVRLPLDLTPGRVDVDTSKGGRGMLS